MSVGKGDPTGRPDVARSGFVTRGGIALMGADELLTVAQCAERAGCEPGAWRVGVSQGYIPPPDDPGDVSQPANRRNPRWRESTVYRYLLRKRPRPAAQEVAE